MRFEWDPNKRRENIRLRELDFSKAIPLFEDDRRLVWTDDRRDYGEPRINMLARHEGRVYALTYTERLDAIRIISFRKANAREQRKYEQVRFD